MSILSLHTDMEYTLAIDNTPDTVEGGSGILLIHPSTGETDRLDTEFLSTDTDAMLVISTRTTAREVKQKLEYYEVDEDSATILDTLSVERGYTRRQSDNVRYVSAPEDIEGIVEETETFLQNHDGKLRVSFDSVTELIYYADEAAANDAITELLELLTEYDAVGMFHLSDGVHEDDTVESFKDLFDGVIELTADGDITGEL
jgi:KaiC/GvpD/RAD55 family RecA-like ATPase